VPGTNSGVRSVVRAGAVVCLCAVAATGCGSSKHATSTSTAASAGATLGFGYDAAAPLGYTDKGVVLRNDGVTVHDVSYRSGGKQVEAFLVERPGKQARPGIVLVHGGGGDRTELLGDAVALAHLGFVALAITAPSSAYPPAQPTSVRQLVSESKAVTVDDVVAVRRAADVLASLPVVDAKRLGYLGWSNGAKTGAFVAASDPRFQALALLSGGADKLAAFVKAAPAGQKALVEGGLGSVDPLRYIALARSGTVLLADGRRDTVVPHTALVNMIRAAPKGTLVRWYDAGHELNATAYHAAFAWLVSKLQPPH
jgi:dienelactone hydrolase